ncbi:MAG: TatD family hydrolase [Deltaproteobacteria bacterium]|nr:TatD family hydrolase [Deltaproteobacteria bacterium]
MLIDTHAHLDMDDFLDDLRDVLDRAERGGVGWVVTVGSEIAKWSRSIRIAHENDRVFAAVGLHPHEASSMDRALGQMEPLLNDDRLLALGEIGLDYHYEHSPREEQERAFQIQIEMARAVRKPIIVHVREAHDQAIRILREGRAHEVGGVIHCFTGSAKDVNPYLDLGFLISFTGILTFKKADDVRSAAAKVPLDRVMVETDAPYLAPIPHRGKRNEPAFVVHVARALAELLGMSPERVFEQTTRNAVAFFGLPEFP